MRRFFISPQWLRDDDVSLPASFARRLLVLGLGVGDQVVLLDDHGWAYQVELMALARDGAVGRVVGRSLAGGERRTKITLYQGLMQPRAFATLLRKGTELGLVEFVPLITDRCTIASLDSFKEERLASWRKVIQETAERAGRGRLPRLQPAMLFDSACDRASRSGLSLILWKEAEAQLGSVLQHRPFSIHLFAGPPMGFTAEEVDRARGYGVIPVSLGPVRARTTGLTASRIIFDRLK
ncbi:MAG TPA: 16S rRNA (uracil(1498)-N(3))-methyltransferase [Anaerolineae bacterium]|nr:16S rRNA (uracil(1498)-N(3))-methyltransferase [Anaerolineae bacterium]